MLTDLSLRQNLLSTGPPTEVPAEAPLRMQAAVDSGADSDTASSIGAGPYDVHDVLAGVNLSEQVAYFWRAY